MRGALNSTRTPKRVTAAAILAACLVFAGLLGWAGVGRSEAASGWQPTAGESAYSFGGRALVQGGASRSAPMLMGSETLRGSGGVGPYTLSQSGISPDSLMIYIENELVPPSSYVFDQGSGVLFFLRPVPVGSEMKVRYRYSGLGTRGNAGSSSSNALGLLPVSSRFSLGLIYTENKANVDLLTVRGGLAQFQDGGLVFKVGHFVGAPEGGGQGSYMEEGLARLALAGGTSLGLTSSQKRGGEAVPLFMRLQSGNTITETSYWNMDNSFAGPTDAATPGSMAGVVAALGSSGAPTNDWRLLRGFEHFGNNFATGVGGLSLSQSYSLDKNRQTGNAEFGLSWLNRGQALSFGQSGGPTQASWERTVAAASWQDANRQGAEIWTQKMGLSQMLGRGKVSFESTGWGVGTSLANLPTGGSMPSSTQALVTRLQGLGAPAGDWNQVRGFGHWESKFGFTGIPGVSFSQGRTVDANGQTGHGDFGLNWTNMVQALSLGQSGDSFQASWDQRTSEASWQDPERPGSSAKAHSLSLSQKVGRGASLSFKDKSWEVDSGFNLPGWVSAVTSAQSLVASLQTLGAPANDWNQVRGVERKESSLLLQASPGLSFSRTYNLYRNRNASAADFGLNQDTYRDAVSVAGLGGALQLTLGQTDRGQTWEGSERAADLHGQDISLTQRLGRGATLGFNQVTNGNTDKATLEGHWTRTSNYSWNSLPILRGPGLGISGTLQAVQGTDQPGTKTLNLQTAGTGLRLGSGLSLMANYQENQQEGQGSNSALTLSTSAIQLNRVFKIDSLQFTRAIDAQDKQTHQTGLTWSTKAMGGLTVGGQFQAKQGDGQGYWFNRTFNFTQQVSDKTGLTASYLRQQNGGQRVTATKRLALTRTDPSNLFTYSAIYDEMVDPNVQSMIRPVLETKAAFADGKGISISGKYIQRDQPDNSRLVTKEVHVALPAIGGLTLQGDYARNPNDPNDRDKIQSFTANQRWSLTAPVGRKTKLALSYMTAENLQNPTETDTSDASFIVNFSPVEMMSVGFRLTKNYAPDSYSSRQGLVANYTRNLDANHFLRISATDEPQDVSFVNGMTRSTAATDTRYGVEYGTTF